MQVWIHSSRVVQYVKRAKRLSDDWVLVQRLRIFYLRWIKNLRIEYLKAPISTLGLLVVTAVLTQSAVLFLLGHEWTLWSVVFKLLVLGWGLLALQVPQGSSPLNAKCAQWVVRDSRRLSS